MIVPPCGKGDNACTERTPGCHGICERFKAYREKIESAAKKDREKRDIDNAKYEGLERMRQACSLMPGSKYGNRRRSCKESEKYRRK